MTRTKFSENSIYFQVFSFEVLDYFDSITTEENYDWIEKYFDLIMKKENETAEKFDMHHIRPCCTFKDETHKTRKETQKLANDFNGNLIKLSYKNHILAHYFLWKMFPKDKKFKRPIYMMLEKLDFEHLTEDEIIKFAELQEECRKANMTKEEIKEYQKQWYENNKNVISEKNKERYDKNRDKFLERDKKYRQENKEKVSEQKKILYIKHKDKRKKYRDEHKEHTKEYGKIYYEEHKDKKLEQMRDYAHQLCIDPIINDMCKLNTLQKRKYVNKEKYKNVNPINCIIQPQS